MPQAKTKKDRIKALQKELREFLTEPQFGTTIAKWRGEEKEDYRGFMFSGESGNLRTMKYPDMELTTRVIDYWEDYIDADFEKILDKHNALLEWNDPGTACIYLL